ncbi:hypothetical protein [Burkholderia sp. LMG 32019]|uniref:hypothetical protein n=1 Tax=Burkholderia sp. LMG 32019 TaxID=3158173 RepID=UPI003C2E5219
MNYKKFAKLPEVELKLLSTIEIISQQRLAFKIDNYPNYGISHYDRHNMETYFFSDSHTFPHNVSFVIHVDKEGETIIADDELKDYRAEWDIDGNIKGGEEILSQVLAGNGEIDFSVDRIDGFELHGIEQPLVDNTGKTITFFGGYKTTYSGIQPEGWSIYAVCDVLGINARAVEDHTHLGILAEGLAMMLRKDYKLASFMFYCALESYINYKLHSQSDEQRLSEKLKRLIAATFPGSDLAKHQIYTSTIKEFDQLTGLRNAIAHGTMAVSVSRQETSSHLILVLTLIACIETTHADFPLLAAVLKTHDLSRASARFWSSWKNEE